MTYLGLNSYQKNEKLGKSEARQTCVEKKKKKKDEPSVWEQERPVLVLAGRWCGGDAIFAMGENSRVLDQTVLLTKLQAFFYIYKACF